MEARRFELKDVRRANISLLLPDMVWIRSVRRNPRFGLRYALARPAGALWRMADGTSLVASAACDAGVWERVLSASTADQDNRYAMIDS